MLEKQINNPDGWLLEELGKLISERKKSSLKVSDATNFGNYPFFTSGDAVLRHINKLIDGENVYLATGGLANIKYYEGSAAYSTDTYALTTKDEINTKYLYYNLLNIIYYINANYFQGSGLKHLQKKDFKKHQILFPTNTKEQTQIANILFKTDESIIKTQNLIDKYTRIKTGLIQDLFTKGLDENGDIRSEEIQEFKDSPLGRIPKEWECEFLGNYIDIIGGYAFKSRDFVEDGVQLLRMGNLYNNNLSLNRDPIFLPSDFVLKHPNFVLKKGDIIMSMTGTSGKRDYGFAVEVNIDKPLLLNQRVCKFSFLEDKIDKTYLINLLHYETYLSSLYENASGTKQANLNSENILNIYVPFPSKAEQIIIGKKINALDATLNVLGLELSKLKSLKRGLMQDLLSGIVRVN